MQNRGTGVRNKSNRRKGRYKIRGRFFIFLAIFLAVIVGCIWGIVALVQGLSGPSDAAVTLGMLEDAVKMEALLLRDETVVSESSYVSISYKVSDNQLVSAGDEIVEVYEGGYSQSYVQELEQVRQNIMKYQQETILKNIINEDLQVYDEKIQSKSNELKALTRGETAGKVVDMERELRNLMTQRQDYLKTTQAALADAQLTEYYEKEKTLQENINAWRKVVTSPIDGRISFYFDGFENFLSLTTLPDLTATDVQSMIKSTTAPTPAKGDIPVKNLFRVVNPNHWYVLLSAKDWGIAVGQGCEISFSGYEGTNYMATVSSIVDDGDRDLVVLEVNEDMGSLLNARHVTVVIGGKVEGMVVPLGALVDSNGQNGVYLADGRTFVAVNVLGKDGYDALVESITPGELEAGMRVKVK